MTQQAENFYNFRTVSELPTPLVSARQLSRRYGWRMAVDAISFTLCAGQIVGLLGPNGAGKTSLLRMLSGCLAPSAGTIHVAGHDLVEAPNAARAAIGFLPEHCPLYEELTVDEYLAFCVAVRGVCTAEARAAIPRTAARCGLNDCRQRLIRNLSHGYRQRVGLAQAIVHNPRVLLLDEPTTGLDPLQINEVRVLLGELAPTCCILLSTHLLAEAQVLCERILIIHRGQLRLDSTLESAASRHSSRLRLARPPPPVLLERAGVTRVEPLGDGAFRLHHPPGGAVRERIAELVVARGWGLLELVPETDSLEDTFLRVTRETEQAA